MGLINLFMKNKDSDESIAEELAQAHKKGPQPRQAVIVTPPSNSVEDDCIEIPNTLLKDLPAQNDNLAVEHGFVERRQYRRIQQNEIQRNAIEARCYNLLTMDRCAATILDISPGGLLLVPNRTINVGNKLHVNCRVGKRFHLDEVVVVKSVNESNSGVAFVDPKDETESFILGLYGALGLSKPAVVSH